MSLSRFFRRRQWNRERARELESHLAHEIDDNVARGMMPKEARRQASVKFGDPTVIREEIWQMNSFVFLENLGRDVRYAHGNCISLRDSPLQMFSRWHWESALKHSHLQPVGCCFTAFIASEAVRSFVHFGRGCAKGTTAAAHAGGYCCIHK